MEAQKKNEEIFKLKKVSPTVAVVLSLVVCGTGHFYLGKWGKGLAFLFVQGFLWLFLMGWIMWIIVPIDAYREAKKQNKLLRLELNL